MFSPALIRYIVDPENTLEYQEENTTNPIQRRFCKVNNANLNKIQEDYGFFSILFDKIKTFFAGNKNPELLKRE